MNMSQSNKIDKKDEAAAIKLCHIVKRPDFDGYGFNLHSEKANPGQFIGNVDAESPAEAAGLKKGDRIIEVNGVSIEGDTHKQVVQRIKAIANEVRLLLIDVDGKGEDTHNSTANTITTTTTTQSNSNGKLAASDVNTRKISNASSSGSHGNAHVVPGISENINSITMVSTKRVSQECQHSADTVMVNGNDQVDHALNANNNNSEVKAMPLTNVPPPPSATMSNNNNNIATKTANGTTLEGTSSTTTTTTTTTNNSSGNGTIHKAGSLQLPLTAAEMRAKLMARKKYDPKNESVDLRKKYEIVQKL